MVLHLVYKKNCNLFLKVSNKYFCILKNKTSNNLKKEVYK